MNFTDMLNSVLTWITTEGLKILIGLVLFFILCKVINAMFRKMEKHLEKRKVEITIRRLICNWGRRIIKFILLICLLGYWGIDTSGIAAAIASVGLTIGLALQGSLANFAGGLVIIVLHPFKVGDYIEVSGVGGTVDNIELFHTYLVTPDNKMAILPNGSTANATVINFNGRDTRRNDLIFSISYNEDFKRAKQIISDVIADCEYILADPAPFVNITKHNDSSIDLLARFWATTDQYWNAHFYMLEAVKTAFDENGIEIPFPQLDVHVKDTPQSN